MESLRRSSNNDQPDAAEAEVTAVAAPRLRSRSLAASAAAVAAVAAAVAVSAEPAAAQLIQSQTGLSYGQNFNSDQGGLLNSTSKGNVGSVNNFANTEGVNGSTVNLYNAGSASVLDAKGKTQVIQLYSFANAAGVSNSNGYHHAGMTGWYTSLANYQPYQTGSGTGNQSTHSIYSYGPPSNAVQTTNAFDPANPNSPYLVNQNNPSENATPTDFRDRALGLISQGNLDASNVITFGLLLRNDTGKDIQSFDVSYLGEQWRAANEQSAGGIAARLKFSYAVVGTSDVAGLYNSSFSDIPSATFTRNVVANSDTVYWDDTVTGSAYLGQGAAAWNTGEYIWMRWQEENTNGSAHGLAIDSIAFNFQPVPAPPPVVSLGIGGGVMGLLNLGMVRVRSLRRRRRNGEADGAPETDTAGA